MNHTHSLVNIASVERGSPRQPVFIVMSAFDQVSPVFPIGTVLFLAKGKEKKPSETRAVFCLESHLHTFNSASRLKRRQDYPAF